MLKDNHLSGIGITEGVARARDRWPGRTIHVECERLAQVIEATEAGADALLLDNMTPDEITVCVRAVSDMGLGRRRPLLEISGGVTLENAHTYAAHRRGHDLIGLAHQLGTGARHRLGYPHELSWQRARAFESLVRCKTHEIRDQSCF